mgnify:CR=1 FL=1
MEKVIGVVVVLLLAIALLPACGPGGAGGGGGGAGGAGGGGGEGEGGGAPPSYTGFVAPTEGQWAEYVVSSNGEEYHQKMECIGEDTVDGKTCIGFEMTMAVPQGGENIVQMWTEAATHQPVKYVMKMEGKVYCMGITSKPPETETPSSYDPNLPNISYGTYTTPTGKTVNVAKFTVDGGEGWVSSQVPLGMVKVIDASGKTAMYLHDFGTSGAHRDISKVEMENCIQMPGS